MKTESPPGSVALTVDFDFPGGSAKNVAVDRDSGVIRFLPGGNPDRGWPCWWYLHVTGIRPGQVIVLEVGAVEGVKDNRYTLPNQATFSTDRCKWRQTGPGQRQGDRIIYRQEIDGPEAWFAWGPPYVTTDANRLIGLAEDQCAHAKAFELCRSLGNRPVPALRVRQPGPGDPERYGIFIVARQHAWESGSSWVCRGFVEWLVSNDERAGILRKKSDIIVVPIMDVDNVESGNGGKNELPHDHNRDWSGKPHFPAVVAAQKIMGDLDAEKRLDLFLDLHNPGPMDGMHFHVTPKTAQPGLRWANTNHFLDEAAAELCGPMIYNGDTRQTGENYDRQNWRQIGFNWVALNTREHVIAPCFEIPWNVPSGNTEGYMAAGRQMGLAIERYFRKTPRQLPAQI